MITIKSNPVKESPLSGNIIFYQHMIPPLSSSSFGDASNAAINGAYTLTVDQTVSSTDGKIPETTYQNKHDFIVQAPRFALTGNISSVYPPHTNSGEFSNVLPHVCLNRATLPWERSAQSTSKGLPAAGSDQAPWLGLLLLYETDPAVKVQQVTLQDLATPGDNIFFPSFELEYGEKYTDSCLAIDIPVALFNQIAPAKEDLPWLAHVREIQPSIRQSAQYLNKLKQTSSETAPPVLSTVICNRLPQPGSQNVACLVSFENWAAYLPGNDGTQSPSLPPGTTHVRLVLFRQWQFFAINRQQTFSGYLMNLNKQDGQYSGSLLQLPVTADISEEDKAINNAFNMGMVPLNHHTRQGDQTVSWYKGPFLPYLPSGSITTPVNGPDTCTNYNPDTGMFDVSYAAAWQLGRLLALQNGHFATTLYNWKRSNTQTAIANFEEEMIRRTLKDIVDNEEPPKNNATGGTLDAPVPDLLRLINFSLGKILSQFISNKDGETSTQTQQR